MDDYTIQDEKMRGKLQRFFLSWLDHLLSRRLLGSGRSGRGHLLGFGNPNESTNAIVEFGNTKNVTEATRQKRHRIGGLRS